MSKTKLGNFAFSEFQLNAVSFESKDDYGYMSADCHCYFGEDLLEYGLSLQFSGYAGEKQFEGLSNIGNFYWNDTFDIPEKALLFITSKKDEIQRLLENILREKELL